MNKKYIFLVCLIVTILLAGCSKQVFDGSRTSNDTQFLLEYHILNDTKTHSMELEEGDVVAVVIENLSGRLDIIASDINGKEIYRGNNAISNQFNLIIPKTNTYIFTVTGKNAKGFISFEIIE